MIGLASDVKARQLETVDPATLQAR
jgi:hypothetical protein